MKKPIADFKTERNDILPPLPSILKVVPVGFVLGLLGLAAMAAYSFHGTETLKKEAATMRQEQATVQAQVKTLQAQELQLNTESKQAKEVQTWITGSSEMYPVIMKIARTLDEETSITELKLDRVLENPSHMKMELKMYSPTWPEQADNLSQAISDTLKLRQYAPATVPSEKDENEVTMTCFWAPSLATNEEN